MAADALVDTGAIVAMLDERDPWSRICRETFQSLRVPLVTSQAVLTELFHLVGDNRREMEGAWGFVRSGALRLAEIQD